MPLSNYERMIKLADDSFAAKSDPDQLDVDQEVIERLQKIHPDSVSEYDDGNGPVAWVVLLPTTFALMQQFLDKEITERELYDLTPFNITYDALYLCSALVLDEYRRKGIAKRLALEAIAKMRRNHPIKALFVWVFSHEGDLASATIAAEVSLPLYKRLK